MINGDRFASDVSVVDTVTNKVVVTVPLDAPPSGVAVNPVGTKVYVAAGRVSIIDSVTNTVVGTIDIAASDVAFNPKVHARIWTD